MTVDLGTFKGVARWCGLERRHLVEARLSYERRILPAIKRRRSAPNGRVLCYHSIGTEEWGANDVAAPLFKRHLETAIRLGYRFVPADHIAAGRGTERDLALTFDDGLMSSYRNAAPILKSLRIPWSLFVVCDWADGKHVRPELFMGWSEIREVASTGVAIGSHSLSHPDFGSLSKVESGTELWESRRRIRERAGVEVDSFAIPFGQSRNWRGDLSMLATSLGYRSIYAQAVDSRADGTVPRTFVTRYDDVRIFRAALRGAFDQWEERL